MTLDYKNLIIDKIYQLYKKQIITLDAAIKAINSLENYPEGVDVGKVIYDVGASKSAQEKLSASDMLDAFYDAVDKEVDKKKAQEIGKQIKEYQEGDIILGTPTPSSKNPYWNSSAPGGSFGPSTVSSGGTIPINLNPSGDGWSVDSTTPSKPPKQPKYYTTKSIFAKPLKKPTPDEDFKGGHSLAAMLATLQQWFLTCNPNEAKKFWDVITCLRGPDSPSETSSQTIEEREANYLARRRRKYNTVEIIRSRAFPEHVPGSARHHRDTYIILPKDESTWDHFDRHCWKAALAIGLEVKRKDINYFEEGDY